MKTIYSFLLSASLFALTSCDEPVAKNAESNVLAVIGKTCITLADFEQEIERRRASGRPLGGKVELLEEMVQREVLLQSALKAGFDKDPEVERAYANLLIGKLREKELTPELKALRVTESETRAAYAMQKETFTRPSLRKLSIIYAKAAPGRSESRAGQLKSRMEEAREMATCDPMGFAAAAVKYSDDQATRYRGGDLGWTVKGKVHARIPQAVMTAGHELKSDGAVSRVIEASNGFYLVKCVATKPSETMAIARVSKRLEAKILQEKRDQIQENYKKAKETALVVRRFPQHLAKIEVKALPIAKSDQPPTLP